MPWIVLFLLIIFVSKDVEAYGIALTNRRHFLARLGESTNSNTMMKKPSSSLGSSIFGPRSAPNCVVQRRVQAKSVTPLSMQPSNQESGWGVEDFRLYMNALGFESEKPTIKDSVNKWMKNNWLIIGELIAIGLAWMNPSFGATGGPLRPEITISKIAISIIFFINGIALNLNSSPSEMKSSVKTNSFIQIFNFAGFTLAVRALAEFYPDPAFRDGLRVLSCLPCTINISVAQTLAAGGNMGTAIFNAIFGNVLGVFLTPLLCIWMLGASSSVSLFGTLKKLGSIVILPLILGQAARYTKLGEFQQKYNRKIRNFSSCLLLAIVYNIFSDTFNRGFGITGPALVKLAVTMPSAYLIVSVIFWQMSKSVLPGLDIPTRGWSICSIFHGKITPSIITLLISY